MKILHTSDWHLGRTLYGKRRYTEFSAFLDWLLVQIKQEAADALLIAGDIFDTTTPSNQAQELYYRFLYRAAGSGCRHIVIIGGNHDSPGFLNAPAPLLKILNVHMVGSMKEDTAEEVLELKNPEGSIEALVCAVPYLRDRDIRQSVAGESLEDKQTRLLEGISGHYKQVCDQAEIIQKLLPQKVPLIAMGHLFTAGGTTVEHDGVRDLYVGSLAMFSASQFPSSIDYLALGHLHVPQKAGKKDHIRYCGSPLPMGFGEADQTKLILSVDFSNSGAGELFDSGPEIKEIPVPCFQPLKSITGNLDYMGHQIEKLKDRNSKAWLDIELTGELGEESLREEIDQLLEGSSLQLLRLRNRSLENRVLKSDDSIEELEELEPEGVFQLCLDRFQIPPEEQAELEFCHGEILKELQERDSLDERGAAL